MTDGRNQKNAAIYCRISSNRRGESLGIDRQEQACRELAKRQGMRVVEVYRDDNISASVASKKPRPEYNRMIADAEAGHFGVILCYDNARLTRRMGELVPFTDWLTTRGMRYVSVDGDDTSSANGEMTLHIKGSVSQQAAKKTGELVRASVEQRAKNGWWHGGQIPYGYRLGAPNEDGVVRTLEIESAEAKVVRDIAKRILADQSMYSITLDYTRRGMRTRKGNLWKAQTMRGMMLSPTIIGMRQIEGELVKAKWKPIITRKQWDQLREILTDPKRDFGPLDGAYGGKRALGGGLTKCAECGSEMVSSRLCRHNKDEHGKRKPGPRACDNNSELLAKEVRLVCQFKATGGCGKVGLNNKNYEDWVLDLVFDRLDDPTFLNAAKKPILKANDRLAALRLERRGLDARLDRAKSGLLDGIFDAKEVKKVKDRVDADKERIDKSLDSLQSDDVLAGIKSSADARELWKTASVVTKRKFIASLIEEIKVGLWPLDPENEDKPYPSTLTRWTDSSRIHKAETANEFEDRKTKHARVILRKRCEVIWRF